MNPRLGTPTTDRALTSSGDKTTSATSFYHSLVSVSFNAGIHFLQLNEENGSLIDSIAIGIGFLSLAR